MFKSHCSQVWSLKDHSTHQDAGARLVLEYSSLENQMELLTFGILWINLINGQCNMQWGQLVFLP